VKLGKNASDTCAVLSKADGGEVMKKAIVFEWQKRSKEGCEKVQDAKITNQDNAHHFLQYQGYCSL
jgi:hypothetical protein